jgi:hypothetical protein
MKRPSPTDAVERRLQEEARTLRTQTSFSPLLHARIISSLHNSDLALDAPFAPRRHTATYWRLAIPAGIAAALAVGTWLALRPTHHPNFPAPKITSQTQSAPIIPTPQPAPTSTDIATTTLERGKYAYLDRDANRLFTFVADQIPSFPQRK